MLAKGAKKSEQRQKRKKFMHKQNASMGVPNSAIVKGSKKQMISKPQQFNN